MKLFYTKSSPYAACVLATIAELKAEHLIELVESAPFENAPEFILSNPLGKVPCLIDEGMPILDSEVICDYIDANISGGLLFEDIYANWHLKTFYSICSGLIDASVNLRIETLRDQEGIKSEFWWQRHSEAIERTLLEIETRLSTLPEKFSIIHIAIFCALGYLDFRHPHIKWRENRLGLVEFYDSIQSRECFSNLKLG
ncbi:MAG: glutathione S-transferase N-terminal domain-containing protein [Kangiellaceae bacterium]|nr:glutathione S-transferase N-terminal domain-containing protein [Kangiellaceae bacterium]